MLQKAGSLFDRFLDLQALLSGAILIFMMLLTCYEIIARYVFQTSPAWVSMIGKAVRLPPPCSSFNFAARSSKRE